MSRDDSEGTGGDSSLLEIFRSTGAIVLGEAMLDVYMRGRVSRLGPEGPFPVVESPVRDIAMGGAANVAANIAALGASAQLVSVVGRDRAGAELTRLAAQHRVDVGAVEQNPLRRTLEKTRILGEGLPLARMDEGSTSPISDEASGRLISHLARMVPEADAMIVSDYRYGVVDPKVLARLRARKERPLLVVDSKDLTRFRDVHPDIITSNYAEVVSLLGADPTSRTERVEKIRRHASQVLAVTGAGTVAVTLDDDGVVLISPGEPTRHVPAPVEAADPCGAGDTFTAAMSLAVAAGAKPVEAVVVGQRAAGIVAGKRGTAVCTVEELRGRSRDKWCDHERVIEIVQRQRCAGRSIVFTNGCFDVLHSGHVASLEEAARLGDVLVVAINSDASVARLKGAGRPVNSLADRMEVLAGLSVVDYLVAFEEDTPVDLLSRTRPDVYCKGGDYRGRWTPETDLVRGWNGRVHYTAHVPNRSTTATLKKIQSNGVGSLEVVQ